MKNLGLIMAIVVLVSVAIIGLLVYSIVKESTKPLPGVAFKELGRDHVQDISSIKYNSNPPTSGPHFSIWAKRGVYDKVISDGHLVHSLEHGYIVLSYNCDISGNFPKTVITSLQSAELKKLKLIPSGTMSAFSPDDAPKPEVVLSDNFKTDSCKMLVNDLSSFLNDFHRVIVVSRPNMDYKVAVAAWGRLLTQDTVNMNQIREFITRFENQGPEKTIE